MTSTSTLPWDTDGTTVTTSGTDMHARATSLAHAAMEKAAKLPVANLADSDYGREQARFQAELLRIRAESAQKHIAANNARAEAAALAKAERAAAHQARIDAAKQGKIERKLAKAA